MSIESDIEQMLEQEKLLRFKSFNADTAWELGSLLRAEAMSRKATMTFEVQLAGRVLFHAVTGEAPAGQADWIRRKRNTVLRFGRSSYAMGRTLEHEGKTIEERHGLTLADYAFHGGGFPLLIAGTGQVGSVVVSGLPQREDHAMVVYAMAAIAGVSVPALDD